MVFRLIYCQFLYYKIMFKRNVQQLVSGNAYCITDNIYVMIIYIT